MSFFKCTLFLVCLCMAQESFSSQGYEENDLEMTMVCDLPNDPKLQGHTRLFVNINGGLFFEHKNSRSQIFLKPGCPPVLHKLSGAKEVLSSDAVPSLQQLMSDQRPEMRALSLFQTITDKIASLQARRQKPAQVLQRGDK